MQVDCGVMHYNKLTDRVYTRDSRGFWVTETAAPIVQCGDVVVFYHKVEHLSIEEICLHGPNVISFQVVTGRRWCNIVGCYIAPSDALTIEDFIAAIRYLLYGAKLLVASNLNGNMEELERTPRSEAITGEKIWRLV